MKIISRFYYNFIYHVLLLILILLVGNDNAFNIDNNNNNMLEYFKNTALYNISKNKSFVLNTFEKDVYYMQYSKNNTTISSFSISKLKNIIKEANDKMLRYGNLNVAFFRPGNQVKKMLIDYKTYRPQLFSSQLIRKGLKIFQTLNVNKAGIVFKEVALMCKHLISTFGTLVNANMYITNSGAKISIPPHNDRQDVLIYQINGKKQWTMYEPEIKLPVLNLEVGKGKKNMPININKLKFIKTVLLNPGDLLYIPRGMVHVTSTKVSNNNVEKPIHVNTHQDHSSTSSIHITFGVESDTIQTTYLGMAQCCMGIYFKKTNDGLHAIKKLPQLPQMTLDLIRQYALKKEHIDIRKMLPIKPIYISNYNNTKSSIIKKMKSIIKTIALSLNNAKEEAVRLALISITKKHKVLKKALKLIKNVHKKMLKKYLQVYDKAIDNTGEMPIHLLQNEFQTLVEESSKSIFSSCGFDNVVVDGQNMVDNVVIDDNGKSVGSGTRRRSNNNNRGGEL